MWGNGAFCLSKIASPSWWFDLIDHSLVSNYLFYINNSMNNNAIIRRQHKLPRILKYIFLRLYS